MIGEGILNSEYLEQEVRVADSSSGQLTFFLRVPGPNRAVFFCSLKK